MDPRTSSKVTAPDLLAAFNEGRGTNADEADSETLTVYVMKFVDEVCVEVCEFLIEAIDAALDEVKHHMLKGARHDVIVMVDPEEPGAVATARAAISASSD
jgi:hypothetical protein